MKQVPASWPCTAHDGQGPAVDKEDDMAEVGGSSGVVDSQCQGVYSIGEWHNREPIGWLCRGQG